MTSTPTTVRVPVYSRYGDEHLEVLVLLYLGEFSIGSGWALHHEQGSQSFPRNRTELGRGFGLAKGVEMLLSTLADAEATSLAEWQAHAEQVDADARGLRRLLRPRYMATRQRQVRDDEALNRRRWAAILGLAHERIDEAGWPSPPLVVR